MISVFILPSNTIFWKTEKELSESEIEEEERGREHTPPASQASTREIAPRERLNLEPRALRLRLRIAPFDFAVQLWLRIILVAPQNRSSSTQIRLPQSRSRFRADRDRSRNTDSSSSIAIVAPQNRSSSTPKPIVLSLFLLLSIWPDYEFFFSGFYLCFWIEGWNYIFVW